MTCGLIIAAAASHSGKTTLTLGLIAALRARGMTIAAAKCGPDYIDPRFLAAASGAPAINLDPWAMPPDRLRMRLAAHAAGADLAIVEGVMGLYDGGANGAGSTTSLAAALGLPVVLVVGASGLAQTAAAIAEGCARMAEAFEVVGAIANLVASDRHADLIREGFRRTSVPLLGLVRRDASVALASRHLGLVQAMEQGDLAAKIARAAELVAAGCDLDAITRATGPLPPCGGEMERGDRDGKISRGNPHPLAPIGQRIAIAEDVAFAFAYPHLLKDWRDAGAELSFFSPLADEAPPADADVIYLPGGYPELHAGQLAANTRFLAGLREAAQRGALIYGECGGYMVLGESLTDADGASHRMAGLLPLVTSFAQRKLHLGYRTLTPRPGAPWAMPLAAHEFHFASIVHEGDADRLFDAEDADGAPLGAIGLRRGRVMGSFAHVIDAR